MLNEKIPVLLPDSSMIAPLLDDTFDQDEEEISLSVDHTHSSHSNPEEESECLYEF